MNFCVVDLVVSAVAHLLSGFANNACKIEVHFVADLLLPRHLRQLVVLAVLVLNHRERRQVVAVLLVHFVLTASTFLFP